MALKSELMASSLPAAAAGRLGFDTITNVVPAGNSQATATAMPSNFVNLTTGTGGVIISQTQAMHLIINNSGANITIYPPVGSFINNGTVNAGFVLNSTLRATVFTAGNQFFVNLSA